MDLIKISEVLQRKFKSRGLSVAEVSRRLDIPKRSLHSWYTGENIPSGKALGYTQSLAEFLKISLHHLLFNVIDKESYAEVLMSATFKDGKSHYRLTIERLDE